MSVAWSTGSQLIIFCFKLPVVLFGSPNNQINATLKKLWSEKKSGGGGGGGGGYFFKVWTLSGNSAIRKGIFELILKSGKSQGILK